MIDMKFLNHVKYNAPAEDATPDVQDGTVTVGPGAHWAHLVRYLNTFGLSPMTMQSYCTFSVGGTCAVNAHGDAPPPMCCPRCLPLHVLPPRHH